MNRRGFTLLETLIAIAVAGVMLGLLTGAMHGQGQSALFQIGTADMQQNVRGALDLFQREVRMAGYGMTAVPPEVLPALEVPATADRYALVLRGNYDNVRSRGSAVAGATTITLDADAAPFPLFLPGERVAIESALLGVAEVRTVTAYDQAGGQISLDDGLDNAYEAGSPVHQLHEFNYRLDANNVLWRDAEIIADQIDLLDLLYVLRDGTKVPNPAGLLPDLRGATIHMHSEQPERGGLQPQAGLSTEVRIRNSGIVRPPMVEE